jgi:hypothetical protein
MSGSYCRYCGRRCFVLRTLPAAVQVTRPAVWPADVHLATCAAGAAHDRAAIGYDHTTTRNPRAAGAA